MELIYSVRRKPLKCEPPHYESVTDPEIIRPIVTISTGNIIAFTSPTELTDVEGDSWGGHVYVCDLDTPWDSHKVTSTVHPVTALEWDEEGKHLVVGTSEGDINVYSMKDYLLNQWQCLYAASFPGEHILAVLPFSSGRRLSRAAAPDVSMAERGVALRPVPTLKGFGWSAVEGCACVSGHGAVCIVTRGAAGGAGPALTATDTLHTQREHVTKAALAHSTNGTFLIAALTDGSIVRVSRAACSGAAGWGAPRPPPPALTLTALTALVLPRGMIPASITWSISEECERLIVGGTAVCAYTLTDTRHAVHSLLNKVPAGAGGNTTPGGGPKTAVDSFSTLSWVAAGQWVGPGGAAGAARGRHVVVGGTALHLLTRDMHHVSSRALPSTSAVNDCSPPKKTKYGVTVPEDSQPLVCGVCISFLCGVAVCVDAHAQLHTYHLPPPWPDATNTLAVQLASAHLEWAMVAALDTTDALMMIRPKLMELVYERITESFQRQPAPFQQYYLQAWMKVRMALARSMPSASRLSALTSAVSGAGAWASLAAAARDAPPDDRLAAVLHDAPDMEKALLALEAKSEGGWSSEAAVGALRRPQRRALHTALTALAARQCGHSYEIWSEPSAILTLRKILAVCRGGGGGGSEAVTGRLLARAQHAPLPLKQDLQEEIASVCAGSGRVWDALPRVAVTAPHGRPGPHMLEYGVPPEGLRVSPEPPPFAGPDAAPGLHMDSIRYLYLGGGPLGSGKWRGCCRCGARGAHTNTQTHTAGKQLARAHDARFLAACRCGGKWTMYSNFAENTNIKTKINT